MTSPPKAMAQKLQKLDSEPFQDSIQPTLRSINDLPDELLLEVAKHLEGDNPALGSLIQTSRRLKEIGGELMCRTIRLPRNQEDSLVYLVRTVIERPELRSKPHELSLSTTTMCTTEDGEIPVLVPMTASVRRGTSTDAHQAMLHQISQSLSRLHLLSTRNPFRSTEELYWRSQLMYGKQNYLAGLLLALCDNLDTLHINVYHLENLDTPTVDICHELYGIKSNVSQPPPGRWSGFTQFHTIKRLRIFGGSIRMLQLPFNSLQVLDVDLWWEFCTEDPAIAEHRSFGNIVAQCVLPPYPNLNTLTVRSDWGELDVDYYQSDEGQLLLLLQKFAQSTITHLEILFVRSPTVAKHWLGSFDGIASALRSGRNVSSLNYMKIDYEVSDHFDPKRCFGGCTTLFDFDSFSKLTKMEVLQGALVYEARNTFNQRHYFNGIMPPPSLESLTVICPTVVIFGWLDMLVRRKTEVPNLSEITFLCRLDYGAEPKEFEGDVATCIFEELNDLGVAVRVVEEKLGAFAARARKEGSVWEADWAEGGWVEGLFGEEEG